MYFYQSECLKEVFNELDTSSDVLQILMSPDAPFLQLSTFGNAGSTHVSGVTQWPLAPLPPYIVAYIFVS